MSAWKSVNHVQEASSAWAVPFEPVPPALLHESVKGGSYARHNIRRGERFGELTTIEIVGKSPSSGANIWICKCSCGGDALRSTASLNHAVRIGCKPCCAVCHRELRNGIHATRADALREAYRRQYVDCHTLWTAYQTAALMTNIRNDLEAEFGPIPEEEETGPWNIAVGFPYSAESQYADPVVSTKKPAAKQTEEKVQPDELSAQLALAIGSGDRERIEKALDESLEEERSQKVELSVEPTLPDRPYNGQVVKRCISCGQRIVWRPSEGECLCSVKCRRHYEKQTGRKTRTTLEMEAKSVREHKDRKARDREAVDCATRKERARATRDAFIFGPTIKSLQRQFVEQHDIHANFVKVCHVQGYPVLSFTMTNRQDQPLYVIQYEDRHGWILGALSAEQAVTDWLAHRAISGAQ